MAENESLLYQRWETTVGEGNFEQANKYYMMMVGDQLAIPKAHYLMGLWYRQNGQYDGALSAFQLSIEQGYENLAESYFELAGVFQEINEQENAEYFYKKSLDLQPDFIDAIFCLGQLLSDQGKNDESLQCFYQVLQLGCHEVATYINVAVELSHIGRGDEAIEVYFKALILEPDNYFLYSNLGTEFAEVGDYESAVFCHQKAINYNHFVSDLWYNFACTYSLMQEGEKGLAALEKAFSLDPSNKDYAAVDEELDFLRTQPKYWKMMS